MCTMTWWRDENGYEVFFNRDELKTRCRALPPALRVADNGTRFLAPADPDAGGTWMLVNESGLTVCLLNRWHETAARNTTKRSRGRLVLDFAGARHAVEVIKKLRNTDCASYKAFTLVAIDRHDLLVEAWDGKTMSSEIPQAPLTSSSYRYQEVRQSRCERYRELEIIHPDTLRDYQSGKDPPTAYTVRMNRPDAQTWSRSHVVVGPSQATWRYLEEMPDLAGDSIEHHSKLDIRR
ncbi:MAG: NRDE family protein [Akkermansiaceae bacterium]|nr:NRDE family protein [Akkermansiaceae bacterium]